MTVIFFVLRWFITLPFTTAPSKRGLPIFKLPSLFTAKTSENSMTSPSSKESFSRRIYSPSETLCCFPPLFITAYIFTNYKIEANSIG